LPLPRNSAGKPYIETDGDLYVTSEQTSSASEHLNKLDIHPGRTHPSTGAYLNMPTYLLLALKPLQAIPSALIPETFVVGFPAPDVDGGDVCREFVTGGEGEPAVRPAAFMGASTDMLLLLLGMFVGSNRSRGAT